MARNFKEFQNSMRGVLLPHIVLRGIKEGSNVWLGLPGEAMDGDPITLWQTLDGVDTEIVEFDLPYMVHPDDPLTLRVRHKDYISFEEKIQLTNSVRNPNVYGIDYTVCQRPEVYFENELPVTVNTNVMAPENKISAHWMDEPQVVPLTPKVEVTAIGDVSRTYEPATGEETLRVGKKTVKVVPRTPENVGKYIREIADGTVRLEDKKKPVRYSDYDDKVLDDCKRVNPYPIPEYKDPGKMLCGKEERPDRKPRKKLPILKPALWILSAMFSTPVAYFGWDLVRDLVLWLMK